MIITKILSAKVVKQVGASLLQIIMGIGMIVIMLVVDPEKQLVLQLELPISRVIIPVNGLILPEDLGVTLPHEHLMVDASVWFREPEDPEEKKMAYEPVSLSNLGWIRYHPMSSLDNAKMIDDELAISELLLYKEAGGHSLVEVTPQLL